jgi:hypothetical protein
MNILKIIFKLIFSSIKGSGAAPVRFNGKDLYVPGYYAKRNISALTKGAATGSTVLVIGQSTSGIPFNANTAYPNSEDRVNWIENSSQLKGQIESGDLYDGILFSLNPSNDDGINGAPIVGGVRVNKATQSSLTLQNSDGVPSDLLDLLTSVFGSNSGQTKIKVSAGTNKGKQIITEYKDSNVSADDVGYDCIIIQYTGAGTACVLEINTDSPTPTLTTTVTGGPGNEDLSLDLLAFETVSTLADRINEDPSGSYTASVVEKSTLESSKLDEVLTADAVDILTAYTIKADAEAYLDHFLYNNELVQSAALSASAKRRVLGNISFTFFSGGTNGAAPTQQDWQDAIDMCKSIDASFIVTLTGDAAVHDYLKTHVKEMNSTGRNERQGAVGSGLNVLDADKKAAAKNINRLDMGYIESEVKRFNQSGIETLYPGYIGACAIVGISAGNPITTPPTNKTLNVQGTKNKRETNELNDFIKSGVMVFNPSDVGGIRVVRSVTTYQDSNIIANEWSMQRTALFLTKDHRLYVEGRIGRAGDNIEIESLKNLALERLDYYVESQYFVVDPNLGNAYRNVIFDIQGDVFKMEYEGTLVSPINFALVTHNFTVIGSTAS